MRKGSIAASLFWLSAGWLIIALLATAFLLTELYSRALDNSLSGTLRFHIETLVDRTLAGDDPASESIQIGDPRFDRPASGWYWLIRDADGAVLNSSGSMVGMLMPELAGAFDAANLRSEVETDQFGTRVRAIELAAKIGRAHV